MAQSYALLFDATGNTHETFTVPEGKKLYLVRSPSVSDGTATIQDLLSLTNYVIPNGETVLLTDVPGGRQVSLAFLARSNAAISLVMAEVKN